MVRHSCWVVPVLAGLAACGGGSGNGGSTPPPPDPDVSGLDARPANPDCIAPDLAGGGDLEVDVEPVFTGLPAFNQPLALRQVPGDDSRWFVLERSTGRVLTFDNDPAASSASTFIDISDRLEPGPGEAGLLGIAFHPDFATNGDVFLSYTAPGNPLVSRVSRFTSFDGGQTLDPGSEEVILTLDQPFGNHNGGNIDFGPEDDFLYIGFGDGGGAGDPNDNGQDTSNWFGAMLRIDVDGGTPYAIPPGNPFAQGGGCTVDGCPEIYAWGFRNPWRWSFDTVTGELWLGDVGQAQWEEVDLVELGGNYGWNIREGMHCFGAPTCDTTNLIDPVAEYSHADGASITGGYVYRGSDIPGLEGSFIYGDFGTGRIWALVGGEDEVIAENTNLAISSFGQDANGEVYVVDFTGGRIHRLMPAGAAPGQPVATQLSATGCVAAADPTQPAAGLIPYEIHAPFHSDGADKQRWLAIPDGTMIAIDGQGDFVFPAGSVLMKHFSLGDRLIETRLFMRHPDGDWAGYTYEWASDMSDATLVEGGKMVDLGGQTWIYPSGEQCRQCHTSAAGFSLGLEIPQLNRDFTYPSTGRTANQLATLNAVAMFASPLAGEPDDLPRLADPFDASLDFDARARAYLHTNCAQCHRPGGPAGMDLRFDTSLRDTGACDTVPSNGDLGIVDARVIAPGAPERSVLLERMNRRDADGMPPLATNLIDDAGVQLVSNWIAALGGCG